MVPAEGVEHVGESLGIMGLEGNEVENVPAE
jgi:hypothetical protein